MLWKYYWGFIVLQSPVCGGRWSLFLFATTWQGGHVGGQYNRIFFSSKHLREKRVKFREETCFCSWSPTLPPSRANQQCFFSLFLAVLVRICPFDGCSLCVSPCWSQSLFLNRSWYSYLFSWICLLHTMTVFFWVVKNPKSRLHEQASFTRKHLLVCMKKTEQGLSLLLLMYLKREQTIPKWTRNKCLKPVTKSAGKRVRIVFGLSSDCSIIWREIYDQITKRSPNHFSYWKQLCLMERRPANSSSQVWSID